MTQAIHAEDEIALKLKQGKRVEKKRLQKGQTRTTKRIQHTKRTHLVAELLELLIRLDDVLPRLEHGLLCEEHLALDFSVGLALLLLKLLLLLDDSKLYM